MRTIGPFFKFPPLPVGERAPLRTVPFQDCQRTDMMASAPGPKAPAQAPNPIYSFRPRAGGISTVKYVNLGTQGTIASG